MGGRGASSTGQASSGSGGLTEEEFKRLDAAAERFEGLYDLDNILTFEEADAVARYTGSGYIDLNISLRNGYPLDATQKEDARSIATALAKSRTTETIAVQRFIDAPALMSRLKKGDVFSDRGYVSTTTSNKYGSAGLTRIRIIIPKGTKALAVDKISRHKGEREILLGRGTKFRVLSKNVWEVIP